MKQLIKQVKSIVTQAKSAEQGSTVLVFFGEDSSLMWGIIREFVRDETKKDDWFHVTIDMLSMPPRRVVWTLRVPQINGSEEFTMQGNPRYILPVAMSASKKDKKPKKNKHSKLRLIK